MKILKEKNNITNIKNKNGNNINNSDYTDSKKLFKNFSKFEDWKFEDVENVNKRNRKSGESANLNFNLKSFGLYKNKLIKKHIGSKITHNYLPGCYRDDENYKKRLLAFLNFPNENKIKTYLKFNMKRKFSDVILQNENKGDLTNYYDSIGLKMRNNISLSLGKKFSKFFVLKNDKNEDHIFSLYKDEDIGIFKNWQKQLKIAEMDDDYLTDDDQLNSAWRHTIKEMNSAIGSFKVNRRMVRNLKYHLVKKNSILSKI